MKTELTRLVTFRLGVGTFAADIFSVERVLRYTAPAAVPDLPPWIEGVIEYQHRVIPVVDLRRRVELPEVERQHETRIIVLSTDAGLIGAVVDAVLEVAAVPSNSISPPPPLFRGLAAEFLRGIVKLDETLVVILDVNRVLTGADRIVLEQAMAGVAARA
jgi:purine-binding chemotaxis protein CheW